MNLTKYFSPARNDHLDGRGNSEGPSTSSEISMERELSALQEELSLKRRRQTISGILIMLFSQFPSTFCQAQNGIPYCIAYGYSRADWGDLLDHLRDVPWGVIFELNVSAAACEFYEWI